MNRGPHRGRSPDVELRSAHHAFFPYQCHHHHHQQQQQQQHPHHYRLTAILKAAFQVYLCSWVVHSGSAGKPPENAAEVYFYRLYYESVDVERVP